MAAFSLHRERKFSYLFLFEGHWSHRGGSTLKISSKPKEKKESEVTQSCPTLCDPMDCSLPGSSVRRIFQARVLEWVAIAFSRGSPWPRDWTWLSHTVGRRFTVWATREDHLNLITSQSTTAFRVRASTYKSGRAGTQLVYNKIWEWLAVKNGRFNKYIMVSFL